MIVLLSISNCVVIGGRPVGSSAGTVNGNGDTSQTGDVGGVEEGLL